MFPSPNLASLLFMDTLGYTFVFVCVIGLAVKVEGLGKKHMALYSTA